MALRNANMMKAGSAVTTLELTPPVGSSYMVKDIFVKSVGDKYLTIKIDRKTQGYFRVDNADLGSHLHFVINDSEKKTILGLLMQRGLFAGYPVAEGQTFEISGLGTSAIIAVITYDEYDAGDIQANMPNGTDSKELLYLAYGSTGAVLNTAASHLYDTSNLPSEFPSFPFAADVPAKSIIEVLALIAPERAADDGTTAANSIRSNYFKLVKNREVLFDKDRNGLYSMGSTVGIGGTFEVENGEGVSGEYSSTAKRLPLFFNPSLVFQAGEELNIYITTLVAATAGTMTLAEQEIALVLHLIQE